MPYDVFSLLPHQRVVNQSGSAQEMFDLYSCGIFSHATAQENIELVELQPSAIYRPHYHKHSAAVIYIILGSGEFQQREALLAYQSPMRIDIPVGVVHGLKL